MSPVSAIADNGYHRSSYRGPAPVLLWLALCGSLVFSGAGTAEEACDVDLEHDLRVSSQSVQVSRDSSVLYEIRQGGYLRVGGGEVDLDEQQRRLAERYAGEVAAWAAQWVELVSSAIEFVGESLEVVLMEALGENSDAAKQARQALEKMKWHFDRIAKSEEGVYLISAQEYSTLDDSMGEEMEEVIGNTLGAVLSGMGRKLTSGEGSLATRIKEFVVSAERIGHELEQQARVLGERAGVLCGDMKEIQKLEKSVIRTIPELAPYPLLSD